ncbi:MAG TPA: RNA-binding protein, partial [Nitrososphaeria archaeon]|nr:RNA-binding protein [Nitrososphaeria archaeon]
MKVSIRGIYSTALIGLLQEKGFTIVNPTKSQVERFGITMKNEPDVMIVDSPSDRNCIEIRGSAEVVQELVKTLQSFFEDLVVLHLS